MTTPDIMKSDKLQRDESQCLPTYRDDGFGMEHTAPPPAGHDPICIRPIVCCNEFVALVQSHVMAQIELVGAAYFKNEGIVVGVGPGLPTANGKRTASQLQIGDVVVFQEKAILTALESTQPPYVGQRIVIISERNVICKLQPAPHTIYTETT